MELSQAKTRCIFDDHYGSVFDIDADFDDRSGDKYITPFVFEISENLVFAFGVEAAMEESEFELRKDELESFEFRGGGFDALERFVLRYLNKRTDDEGLLAGLNLVLNPFVSLLSFLVRDDKGFDFFPTGGECLDITDF